MENKCPNCGAPLNNENDKCNYCGSRVEKQVFPQEQRNDSHSSHRTGSFNQDAHEGCLRAIVTLGIISFLSNLHNGLHHRPPRFPR